MTYRVLKMTFAALLMSIAARLGMDGLRAEEVNYPARTITIVSPHAPGSAPDVAARFIAHFLNEAWGKPVVVEDRVGANGNLGMDYVARAEPDGYTLIMAADTNICVNPHIYSTLTFDARRVFVPVTTTVSNQYLLVVNPNVPAGTLPEFVELARRATPPLLYASIGVGSLHHLSMEMLKKRAGMDLSHIPYRGGSATTNAVITNEVQAMFTGASSAGLIQAGKLRALAISGSKRSAGFPDLPTVGEIYPGFAVDAWIGLFAPAGTPTAIVEKLRSRVQNILRSDAFKSRINVSGSLEPLVLGQNDFLELINRDFQAYGALVKDLGTKLD